jgi:DNA-binding transcriptional ArsR family regulator
MKNSPESRLPKAAEVAELFKVLGDPTRIEILRLLDTNPEVACVTFDDVLPASKSNVSYHLKALRTAGLIAARKEGKFHHYALDRERFEAAFPGFLDTLSTVLGGRAAHTSRAEAEAPKQGQPAAGGTPRRRRKSGTDASA